jgi:hypothetical protein
MHSVAALILGIVLQRPPDSSAHGHSRTFEQFFPLVRAIDQRLPRAKRLRVLAADRGPQRT